MTDPNTDCPSRWSSLTEGSKRSGGRVVFGQYICYSVFFSVSGGPYNQVCGRIRRDCLQLTISMEKLQLMMPIYLSGVPVLHGSPRQHIWIFAAGGREMFLVSITVRVTLLLTHCTSHHLWERITSVSLGLCTLVSRDFNCCSLLTDDGHSTSTCCSLSNPLKYLEQPT